jgi:PadR family transcriptional regulator
MPCSTALPHFTVGCSEPRTGPGSCWRSNYSQVAYNRAVQRRSRSSVGGAGSGRGVNRYTEACLLLLLAERSGHGYELADRLGEVFPLPDLMPDLSSIYRVIADLEDLGAIRSRWTAGSRGGRKACELTDDGWQLLRFWEERLRAEQAGLARFFERFRLAEREHQRPR